MRRLVLVLSVALVMAAVAAAMAVPAFAEADPQASCSGEAQSSAETGDVGRAVRIFASQQPSGTPLGDSMSGVNGPNGGYNCYGFTGDSGTGAPGKPDFAQGGPR